MNVLQAVVFVTFTWKRGKRCYVHISKGFDANYNVIKEIVRVMYLIQKLWILTKLMTKNLDTDLCFIKMNLKFCDFFINL